MTIIALLMGILVPSLSAILKSSAATLTRARMTAINRGLEQFSREHSGMYPGQIRPDRLDSTTGSQLLARALYTQVDPDTGDADYPANAYDEYEKGNLLDYKGHNDCMSDLNGSRAMPICYYPSRKAYKGSKNQYKKSDNDELTDGSEGGSFSNAIENPETGKAANDGAFLLIAPGPDRKYFNEDDVTNY